LFFCALVSSLNVRQMPYPRIIGYWGCNPGGHLSTYENLRVSIQKGYNVIIYAFYIVDANGNLNIDYGSTVPPIKSNISSDFIYLISLFGGENGAAPTLSLDPIAWAQNMFSQFVSLHQKYGFDGIDIDLENAWGGTADQVILGLRAFFQLMHNAGYIVSMAPQTTAITPEVSIYQPGNWNSYVPLADTSIDQFVDIVAVQLYNNAVPLNDVGLYTRALVEGFSAFGCPSGTCKVKLDHKKIHLGFPAGPGAAPSGCPGIRGGCQYGEALSRLYNSNPILLQTGGIMTWSIEWDETFSWQFINAAKNIRF